jgi:hypothetical protein
MTNPTRTDYADPGRGSTVTPFYVLQQGVLKYRHPCRRRDRVRQEIEATISKGLAIAVVQAAGQA